MTASAPYTLDVRAELRDGGEPLPRILQAVAQLEADQSLRLLTTFEPIPLFAVLASKGFGHVASRHGESDWETVFTPGTAPPKKHRENRSGGNPAATATDWPAPKDFLDNRGLQPPEPLIRILDALERLAPGEVLEAINEREPIFLYPELETRGAAIKTEKQPDGAVRLLIRHGA